MMLGHDIFSWHDGRHTGSNLVALGDLSNIHVIVRLRLAQWHIGCIYGLLGYQIHSGALNRIDRSRGPSIGLSVARARRLKAFRILALMYPRRFRDSVQGT